MKNGYSCYYLCLVGVLPNELYCKSAGGCENCKFYLEDPAPKDKEESPCSE